MVEGREEAGTLTDSYISVNLMFIVKVIKGQVHKII